MFGIDWNEVVISAEGDMSVDIPEIQSPNITLEDLDELSNIVPPHSESTEYGIDLYQRVIVFVLNGT